MTKGNSNLIAKDKNNKGWGAGPLKNCSVFTVFKAQKESLQNQSGVTSSYYIYETESQDVKTLSHINNFG